LTMALLEVENLVKYFPIKLGTLPRRTVHVKAVDDISFRLDRGETLGLVGESGCGKTTVGRSILRLIEPTAGKVLFDGENLLAMGSNKLRHLRSSLQIIFQDPFSSLNPRMSVGQIIAEPIRNHLKVPKTFIAERVAALMEKVGLSPAHFNRYPHEFSGGQRQRIGIARALALNPQLIVCDEAVSALDVSIQAQIVNLLARLQEEMNLSYLFIAHDLSVVEHISDRVAVMYLGRIVESAPVAGIFQNPRHPYTQALLSAVPIPDPEVPQQAILLSGELPNPLNPPTGCTFHPRCPNVCGICGKQTPQYREITSGHWCACHLV
jgi:oligopeptide/dipeptide ABC transporter ATP-binding protein